MTSNRIALALAIVLMLHSLLQVGRVGAAQSEASEYSLKAAFLFNFADYVTWPSGPEPAAQTPMRFGVLGAQELATNLEAIGHTRHVQGRPVHVHRVAGEHEVPSLHILFISREQHDISLGMLALASAHSVLTVTEHPVMPAGSMINFRVIDGRVRFDIDVAAAQEAQLTISSRLLRVARRVIGGSR
jgi:hypothetical protein